MKETTSSLIRHPSYFQKGGIDLNSPLERGPGVCFLLGKLFNHGYLIILTLLADLLFE